MADSDDCIVEEWLRSLGLVIYTQSFVDNGYDDLEICKQIGELDLDAIGVIRPEQRALLLDAVRILKEEGGTAVYFTLEDGKCLEKSSCDDDSVFADVGSFTSPPPSPVKQKRKGLQRLSQAQRKETQEEGKAALLIYPKVQLKLILRDKLLEDGINLASSPYTGPEGQAGKSSLHVLALQYAGDLSTHLQDVYDRLEELRYTWTLAQDSDSPHSLSSPVRNIHMGPIYGSHTGRATPPPLPTCPPPSSSYTDGIYGGTLQKYLYDAQLRSEIQPSPGNYVSLDSSGMCCIFPRKIKSPADDKSLLESGTLKKKGWFSRNNTVRRSQKKCGYRLHKGDLNASEITMADEDRIALMLLVKDGTISTETAVEVVKKFEADKRLDICSHQCSKGKENVNGDYYDGTSKTLKAKKKKDGVRSKSNSGNYADSPGKCEACLRGLPHDYEKPVNRTLSGRNSPASCNHHPHYLRYHSISQMEHDQVPQSPEVARAMSCSPSSRSYAGHPSNTASPINHYPTAVPGWLYSPSHIRYNFQQSPTHIHTLIQEPCGTPEKQKNKACGKIKAMLQRTSSKSSIVSSESEVSLDCAGLTRPYPTDVIVTRNGDMSYASTNSTVSMSSDSSPAMTTFRCAKNKPRNCSTVEEIDSGSSAIKSGSSIDSLDNGPNVRQSTLSRQIPPPMHLPQGPFLGFARAVRSYSPKDEGDMLPLKSGDIIQVLTITQSGLCRGVLEHKVGSFRYSHVEMVTDKTLRSPKERGSRRRNSKRPKPKTVEELLKRIGLEHLSAVFLLNGYDHLDTFVDIVEDDLNELNIHDPEQRAKLLTAAELLMDYDSPDVSDGATRSDTSCATPSDTPSSLSPATVSSISQATVPSQPASRDSGCYDSNDNLPHKDCKKGQTLLGRVTCCKLTGENLAQKPSRTHQRSCREDGSFTEEDQEVCAITSGSIRKEDNKSSSGTCKKGGRQKTSNGTSESSSQSGKVSKQNLQVASTNNGQSAFSDISESTSSDLSDTSPKKKPKPVPAPRSSCDANTLLSHSQNIDNAKKHCNGTLKSTSSNSIKKEGRCQTVESIVGMTEVSEDNVTNVNNDNEIEQSKRPYDIRLLTMHDFLSSIGLPKYTDTFNIQGFTSVAQVLYFKETELRKLGITEAKHLKKILHAFDWLVQKTKFPSPKHAPKIPVPAVQDRV